MCSASQFCFFNQYDGSEALEPLWDRGLSQWLLRQWRLTGRRSVISIMPPSLRVFKVKKWVQACQGNQAIKHFLLLWDYLLNCANLDARVIHSTFSAPVSIRTLQFQICMLLPLSVYQFSFFFLSCYIFFSSLFLFLFILKIWASSGLFIYL